MSCMLFGGVMLTVKFGTVGGSCHSHNLLICSCPAYSRRHGSASSRIRHYERHARLANRIETMSPSTQQRCAETNSCTIFFQHICLRRVVFWHGLPPWSARPCNTAKVILVQCQWILSAPIFEHWCVNTLLKNRRNALRSFRCGKLPSFAARQHVVDTILGEDHSPFWKRKEHRQRLPLQHVQTSTRRLC